MSNIIGVVNGWPDEMCGIVISHEVLFELIETQIERDATFREALREALKSTENAHFFTPQQCSMTTCDFTKPDTVSIDFSPGALLHIVRKKRKCVVTYNADDATYDLLRRLNELANQGEAS